MANDLDPKSHKLRKVAVQRPAHTGAGGVQIPEHARWGCQARGCSWSLTGASKASAEDSHRTHVAQVKLQAQQRRGGKGIL